MATDAAITMYRGDSYPLVFTITDSATGAAVDLTGGSLVLTVNTEKTPADATNQVFQLVGVLDADPTTGKVTFTPTTIETDQEPAKYFYDVQYTDVSANVRTVVKSTLTIAQDITK